ncbi:ester cyclase [Ktedonospora formicarum]|uniref:Ester cyclase n=1 Tax=Ktedonospora formicarum TaxID=2778364 RepID=A0A8J3I3B5_9CHLR|nr:ester cyclase [Ktedonospora formicarum]GHO48006.1 hypothetical protein KSX_61690 [Ktedonospora formicarum]
MSLEENKALASSSLSLITEKNFAAIDQIYASSYVRHDPDSPQVTNLESYRKYLAGLCTVFPDLHFTVEDVIAEGDQAVCRFRIRGTHAQPWRGLPATGKQVEITGINISRIAEGKIVEDWFNTDIFGLAMQLGAIPSPK